MKYYPSLNIATNALLLTTLIVMAGCNTATVKKTAASPNKTVTKPNPPKPTPPRPTPEVVAEPSYKMAINFTKSIAIENALATAKASNKPVFIDFYTDWCGPCRVMEQYVFTNQSLGQYMNTNFVNYRFDGGNFDADPYIKKYKIQGYPTSLFLAPDGRVLKIYFGSLGYTEFCQMTAEVLRKWKAGK